MTVEVTPEAIVDSILTELVEYTRRRDLIGLLGLFVDDAALFGSDEGEFARGRAGLKDFLAGIFAEPIIYGWTWDEPAAGQQGDVVWFVAAGHMTLQGENAPPPVPYRLSGVLLQVSGHWRFALFNGAQPVIG